MKTIQFTGAEHKIENLHLALGISDNDMPQQSETRVYVVKNIDSIVLMSDILNGDKHYSELTDEEFMNLAEEECNVYTLEGFQKDFNLGVVSSTRDVVRFISVPLFL